MKVVTSIYHLTMKFLTLNGIGMVRGSQYDSRDCNHREIKGFKRRRNGGVPALEGTTEDMITKARKEIRVHYLVQHPDEDEIECFLQPWPPTLIARKIVQVEMNGEKLEGCQESFQSVRHTSEEEVAPPRAGASSREEAPMEDP